MDEGKQNSQSVLNHYLVKKSKITPLTEQEERSLKNAANTDKMQKKTIQNKRAKRLRRLSTMAAKMNIVVKATNSTCSSNDSDEKKEDEQVEEVEPDMQKAIVVADFTAEGESSLSVTKDENVDVIYYDTDSGWAGILKADGTKGYVPIYSIELL